MKRNLFRLFPLLCLVALLLGLLPACEMTADGSIKSITKPYIAQYECVEARLGETDLLEQYEFISVTLLDNETLEVSYKPKEGQKQAFRTPYHFDPKTRELSGEAGILGHKLKEKVIIENGEFIINKTLGKQQLYLKFQLKG